MREVSARDVIDPGGIDMNEGVLDSDEPIKRMTRNGLRHLLKGRKAYVQVQGTNNMVQISQADAEFLRRSNNGEIEYSIDGRHLELTFIDDISDYGLQWRD